MNLGCVGNMFRVGRHSQAAGCGSLCMKCSGVKVADLARFWLSDPICVSVEKQLTTDPEMCRFEGNGSGAPWGNQQGQVKFLIDNCKEWELC